MTPKVGDTIQLKPRTAERIRNWLAEGERIQGLVNEAVTVAALDADVDFEVVAVTLSKDGSAIEVIARPDAVPQATKQAHVGEAQDEPQQPNRRERRAMAAAMRSSANVA